MQSNGGTVVHWEVKPTMDPTRVIFQRIFWVFGPLIKGFPYCRPLISIDGIDFYEKYKGTLMNAMAIDANSQLFLLPLPLWREKATTHGVGFWIV